MLKETDLLKLALAHFSETDSQTPESVESYIDDLLKTQPQLSEHRQFILDAALSSIITSVGRGETLVDDNDDVRWLNPDITDKWIHWNWLKGYLNAEVRRPVKVMNELDESTNRVIDLIGDPNRAGIWDRRGLVVGHVQSGKTQHYTALTSKALDAGFKLVIILSGIHENLRQQTQERVEELIIGKNSRDKFTDFGVRAWSNNRRMKVRISDDPKEAIPGITTLTSVAGDYGAAVNSQLNVTLGQAPVILVVKKNASILRNILSWLEKNDNGLSLRVPTLVIDDEADHSSINTAKTDGETDPTTINRLIRRLIWRCDKVGFVGYTATPYANIFMDQKHVDKPDSRDLNDEGSDLFPKSFIENLDSPTNYIGPEAVFGHEGDESLGIPRKAALPMHEPADDADQWLPPRHNKNQDVSADLPPSLREALRCFLLASAARMALGHNTSHMSMLVHVSRFNEVQEQVKEHVKNEMSSLVEKLRHGEYVEENWNELSKIWHRIFADNYPKFASHTSQQLVKPLLPEWQAVRDKVYLAFDRMKFCNINSTTKENLDYAGTPKGLIVVAIGGDRLSRGLTLEGLCISYFLRGAKAYDTLMQMGRWFGYRPGYAHLCRVYAPLTVVNNFKTIALATEELRREFSRMYFLKKRPTEYGLRVREPRADLLVTAMNKMRRGETIRVHFSDSLVSSLDIPSAMADGNHRAFENLVKHLEDTKGLPNRTSDMASGTKASGSHHRWEGVKPEAVIDFLKNYHANLNVCFEPTANGYTMIASYIEEMNRVGELTDWTIALFCGNIADSTEIRRVKYPAVRRRYDQSRPGHYSFKGVAMGQDEAIDLTPNEYNDAINLHASSESRLSKAAAYRMKRPQNRGLLMLYPIIQNYSSENEQELNPIIGVAVSFPSSSNDSGQEYVCNERKIAEIFGTEFADDINRDSNEEKSTNV
jgi:hypothetical protein